MGGGFFGGIADKLFVERKSKAMPVTLLNQIAGARRNKQVGRAQT
jgi:hypothetical protein